MDHELVSQAIKLFDEEKKWNAYLDLVAAKDDILKKWCEALWDALDKRFHSDVVSEWNYKLIGEIGKGGFGFWYLKKLGENSVGVALSDQFYFVLFVNGAQCDFSKVYQLVKTEDFSRICSGFERIDGEGQGNWVLMEARRFRFGSPYDGYFAGPNFDRLAWFAGNATDKFVEQVVEKVNKFRNSELTGLLQELNQQSQK